MTTYPWVKAFLFLANNRLPEQLEEGVRYCSQSQPPFNLQDVFLDLRSQRREVHPCLALF